MPGGIQEQRHASGRQANQKTTASAARARRHPTGAPGPQPGLTPPPPAPSPATTPAAPLHPAAPIPAPAPSPPRAPTRTPPQTPPESAASQTAAADIAHRKPPAKRESDQPPPASPLPAIPRQSSHRK